MSRHVLAVLLAASVALAVSGCANPDAPVGGGQATGTQPQNTGEPLAPAPPTSASETAEDPQPKPQAALAAFTRLYINWSYRNLTATQRTLAAMSVGPARLAEAQAAASSADDSTIQRGQIENSGQIVSIAPDQRERGQWVIVTRERTSGSTQYQGLPAAYHVTLAHLQHLAAGWAVDEWLPQS